MRARYGDEHVSSARKTFALKTRVHTSAAQKIADENLALCKRLSGVFILVGFIGCAVVASVALEASREAVSSPNLRPLLMGLR
jgi:hypothetical protein